MPWTLLAWARNGGSLQSKKLDPGSPLGLAGREVVSENRAMLPEPLNSTTPKLSSLAANRNARTAEENSSLHLAQRRPS